MKLSFGFSIDTNLLYSHVGFCCISYVSMWDFVVWPCSMDLVSADMHICLLIQEYQSNVFWFKSHLQEYVCDHLAVHLCETNFGDIYCICVMYTANCGAALFVLCINVSILYAVICSHVYLAFISVYLCYLEVLQFFWLYAAIHQFIYAAMFISVQLLFLFGYM